MKYCHRNKTNWPLLIGLSVAILACVAGLGYAAYQSFGKAVADKQGCFSGERQTHTVVLVDASEPRFDTEQARSLHRYFEELYDSLGFNERLSVYTTEGDQVASVVSPRFHVCGQAVRPDQLTAINAEGGSAGYLAKQRKRLYKKVLVPELEALFSAEPDKERRQTSQSPVLEMVADVSRSAKLKAGSRLILISDLIQNSDSVHFCSVKNDMPPFSLFAQRRVYQSRLMPQSLEGVEVEVLMLQRPSYGQFCRDEEEIKRFWRDYFRANGVKSPRVIRIRHGQEE